MQHHRAILKQVGFVLLAVASLDFAYGIYSISQARTYQFNGIVIALAGIALMRGSLGAARIVRWVAAFGISSIIATLLVMHPLLTPAELRAIEFNLYPNRVISWYVTQIAQLALCYFAYRRLSAIALSSTRKKRNTTKLAFILGVGLTVLMTGIIHFTVNSGAGIKAVELAPYRAFVKNRRSRTDTPSQVDRTVDRLNAFLKDPKQAKISIEQDDRWANAFFSLNFLIGGGAIALIALAIPKQMSCKLDRNTEEAIVAKKYWLYGDRQMILPLSTIEGASLGKAPYRLNSKTVYNIYLLQSGGKKVSLSVPSHNLPHYQKIVDVTNDFLHRQRSKFG